MTGPSEGDVAISCKNLTVTFGEVTALADVSTEFSTGSIHVVVGQNGAGKTTFARVVSGLVKPDRGKLVIAGRSAGFGDVAAMRSAGIELVHQSFALPPSFTVAESIEYSTGGGIGFYRRGDLIERCRDYFGTLGIGQIDPNWKVRDLPIEMQQAVEIARALSSNARILILDEPSAVLSPAGIEALFDRIRQLKKRGVTIVLILHKTREVWAIADTITVLRDGHLAGGPVSREETDPESVNGMIMGSAAHGHEHVHSEKDHTIPSRGEHSRGTDTSGNKNRSLPRTIELKGLYLSETTDSTGLNGLSLAVEPGEIVGIAGIEGNGQVALVNTIAGFSQPSQGEVLIRGNLVGGLNLADRQTLGLRIIPFDRNSEGLSLTNPLWINWAARMLVGRPILQPMNPARLQERCKFSLNEWDVSFHTPHQSASTLSGGNAQKLILARELDEGARIIVAAQPTRGLDIGATSFVWTTMRKARSSGCGVLLISSDLDELFEMSDRLLVMLSGRIVREFHPPYNLAETGRAMTGTVQ